MGTIIGAKTCTWQLKLTLGLLEITGKSDLSFFFRICTMYTILYIRLYLFKEMLQNGECTPH